jgi:hypothetical protein
VVFVGDRRERAGLVDGSAPSGERSVPPGREDRVRSVGAGFACICANLIHNDASRDAANVCHSMPPSMKTILLIHAFIVSFCLLPQAFGQGSLTPTAPPAPTMLTLSQIEPRIPVDATHAPGNGSAEFVIASSGSYYLTTNIVGVSGKDGIDIDANNVTLDLNGFSVVGVNGSLTGISTAEANVVIRNGIVSWWTNGINSSGMNVTVEELTVSSNALYGIEVTGSNSSVTGNNVAGNNRSDTGGYSGIIVSGNNNLVQNNHVVSTLGGTSAVGIFALGTGTIVIQNYVEGNGGNDIEWGTGAIVGQYINTTSGQLITNTVPWGNLEF